VEKKLILRGVLVGAVAGLLAFLFARVFAEPIIAHAIDYESARDAAHEAIEQASNAAAHNHGAEGSEPFSRGVQANLGIGVGTVLFGAAMGALFSVVFTVALGRVGQLRPRTLSPLVAGAGFLGIYFVPFLKYPANPPAIGHEETIRARGGLYLLMVLCSLLLLTAAVWGGQRLKARYGNWNATLLAGAGFVAAVGLVMWILPSVGELSTNHELYGNFGTETPQPLIDDSGHMMLSGFPADWLYGFRLYSVAAQVILWGAISLLFAPLAERLLTPHPVGRPSGDLVSS